MIPFSYKSWRIFCSSINFSISSCFRSNSAFKLSISLCNSDIEFNSSWFSFPSLFFACFCLWSFFFDKWCTYHYQLYKLWSQDALPATILDDSRTLAMCGLISRTRYLLLSMPLSSSFSTFLNVLWNLSCCIVLPIS